MALPFLLGGPRSGSDFQGRFSGVFFSCCFLFFFRTIYTHSRKKSPKQGHSNKIRENLPSLFCSNQIKVADLQLPGYLCCVGLPHPSNFRGVKEKSKKLVDLYPLKECTW